MTETNTQSRTRPVAVAGFALLLVALGFVVGFGYHTMQSAPAPNPTDPKPVGTTPVNSNGSNGNGPVAPTVKGLHVSPDDGFLALTAVYDKSRRSSRFIIDLKSLKFNAVESPVGWQDYITQWSSDGRSVLFEREKIPQLAEETKAGLYIEPVPPLAAMSGSATAPSGATQPPPASKGVPGTQSSRPWPAPEPLSLELPSGEKIVAGFWAPDGRLVVKTRRETKALFVHEPSGAVTVIDRSPATYYQNRAVQENGKTVLYVVRDTTGQSAASALYRVQDGRARKLTPDLQDVTWSYVAENGQWMIVCRTAQNGVDWQWSLYRVTPERAQLVKENTIPADVTAVYWSPDYKHIVGAWGKALWIIDIPTLRFRRLGARTDWKAQDVAWMYREQALVVATNGELWKVDAASGAARELWRFPQSYWH